MKSKLKLFIAFIFISILFSQCRKEEPSMIDIFEEEKLNNDPQQLELSNNPEAGTLLVNAERVDRTTNGYHVKGTIFGESESGTIPISSGDFTYTNDAKGDISTFTGYGTAIFPEAGISQYIDQDHISAGFLSYATGEYFKESNDDLPLLDKKWYFSMKMDPGEGGEQPKKKIKNCEFSFSEYYTDFTDPMFYLLGSMEYKKPTKDFELAQIGIGISANKHFEFVPYEFSERMEDVVGGTNFTPFNSNLYLHGEVPIGEYPLTVVGDIFIDTQASSRGELDFFENGFEDAYFKMGMNGNIKIDHELIDMLPQDFELELAHGTGQMEISETDKYLKFAGEYDSEDFLQNLLGAEMLQYIPHTGQSGRIFMSIGKDRSDWELYIETDITLNVPGLQDSKLQQAMLHLTPDGLMIYGYLGLPYNIGYTELIGEIKTNGSFLLRGHSACNLDLGNGLQYDADLDLSIANTGVEFSGSTHFPYNIGKIEIEGQINTDCISLAGMINSNIDFGNNVQLPAVDLSLEASSCSGITLSGKLDVPYGIALVEVEGHLNSTELALSGLFSSNVQLADNIQMPAVDMSITASTTTGVTFNGKLDVPYGIALVQVSGQLSTNAIRFSGLFNSHVNFGNGFELPAANMTLTASSILAEGITFSGNLTFPGKIATVGVSGILCTQGIAFSGNFGTNLDLGFYSFSNSLVANISSIDGASLRGNMTFPGEFGDIYVYGNIQTNGQFTLTGSTSANLDFVVIKLGVSFDVTVSETAVDFSATGHGCLGVDPAEVCYDPSVSVNPDWGNGSFELCINILGGACIAF